MFKKNLEDSLLYTRWKPIVYRSVDSFPFEIEDVLMIFMCVVCAHNFGAGGLSYG